MNCNSDSNVNFKGIGYLEIFLSKAGFQNHIILNINIQWPYKFPIQFNTQHVHMWLLIYRMDIIENWGYPRILTPFYIIIEKSKNMIEAFDPSKPFWGHKIFFLVFLSVSQFSKCQHKSWPGKREPVWAV